MSGISEKLLATWRDRLLRDLHPFTDPGTDLTVEYAGRSLLAKWTQRGAARQLTAIGALEGSLRIEADGRSDTYMGFFAGPTMGDLTGLAKMMLQAQPRGRLFIRTRARLIDSAASEVHEEDAVSLIRQQTAQSDEDDGTRLLVITGEPGAGKTRVLEEVVKSTALDFLEGQSNHLFLYINAQGRALARFNEALATELQDLRSLLTYHAVSTLVRLGLVIPIVDGFDELLGTGGYEDAFSSLSDFLEELDGLGAIVASARSSYYEHEFVLRANRVSSLGAHAWTQRPIQIAAWSDADFDQYVREASAKVGADKQAGTVDHINGLFKNYPELRSKPFFVSRISDLVMEGTTFADSGSVLERLVDAYLVREHTSKLLDRNGKPLLEMAQLRQLYVELAEEMWNQETRQLDARSVRELAEIVLISDGSMEGSSQIVVQRMPTMAFLTNGTRKGSVAFEHETFFSYFLSLRVAERLTSDSYPLERLLGKAVISEEVAQQVSASFNDRNEAEVQQMFGRIASAVRRSSFNQQVVRESGGVLALAFLRLPDRFSGTTAVGLAEVIFPGGSLVDAELKEVFFDGVEFRRVNLCGATLTHCSANNSTFVEISIDARSKLDFSGTVSLEDFRGVLVYSDDGTRLTYEPAEIQAVLERAGAIEKQERQTLRNVDPVVVKLLDILARAYLRSNPVTTENNKVWALKKADEWPQIEDLLVTHGIISREVRDTKGARKTFLRRHVDIWAVLQGQVLSEKHDDRIQAFWDDVQKIFPGPRTK